MPTITTLCLFIVIALCLPGCDKSVSRLAPSELPAAATRASSNPPMDLARVDQLARDLVVRQNWPGISTAVGWGGDELWAQAIGFANVGKHVGLTPDTRIRIGPVSQIVTAAAIEKLVASDRMNLDTPVGEYLPEIPAPYASMTVRELLAHDAGVRDHRSEDEFFSGSRHCGGASDQLQLFVNDPLIRSSDTGPSHSAYGLVLAGAAGAAVSGGSYRDLIRDEILGPLAMLDTDVAPFAGGQAIGDLKGPGQPARASDAALYWPFAATDTRHGLEPMSQSDLGCVAAAEGLVSTPTDLVRLSNALMSNWSQATATDGSKPEGGDSGTFLTKGLGWQEIEHSVSGISVYRPINYRAKSWLGPGVPGGTASLLLVPELKLVVASATNVTFAHELEDFNLAIIEQVAAGL